MPRRQSGRKAGFAALIGLALGGACAQDAPTAPDAGSRLFFGAGDRPQLVAIGNKRAMTYAPDGQTVAKVVPFDPESMELGATTDGRTALIAVGSSGTGAHLFLVDTQTGKRAAIPQAWYDAANPDAGISGDGRLISSYSEGTGASSMIVTVYAWPARTVVAKRTSEFLSAGGALSGEVTVDGAVAFESNRSGTKVVNRKTGAPMGRFGSDAIRSPDGRWVVEFPNRSWDESASSDVIVKDGATGKAVGKLDIQVPETESFGQLTGAFCGSSGRVVAGSGRGVGVYAILSGKMLAMLPAESWQDPTAESTAGVTLACSAAGKRVAVLSGTRLTFHDVN